MLNVNPLINNRITSKLLSEREEREPSGRISASRLGWPLQWQILHYLKVPSTPPDEYALRLFQRGSDVEDRIVDWLDLSKEQKQVECNYRGVIGYCDALMEVPIEVKSVKNSAFKWRQKEGASRSHKLQAELYAKALGYPKYWVAYVSADDLRVLTFEYDVTDEVDQVIDRYEKQLALKEVPVFEADEKWQEDPKYSTYPEWTKLTKEQIDAKLKELNIVWPI